MARGNAFKVPRGRLVLREGTPFEPIIRNGGFAFVASPDMPWRAFDARGVRVTLTGSGTRLMPGRAGMGIGNTSASYVSLNRQQLKVGSHDCGFFAFVHFLETTTEQGLLSGRGDAFSSSFANWIIRPSNHGTLPNRQRWETPGTYNSSTSLVTNTEYRLGFVSNDVANTATMYLNGAADGTGGDTQLNGLSQDPAVGIHNGTPWTGKIYCLYYFYGFVAPTLMAWLAAEPFAPFMVQPKRTYYAGTSPPPPPPSANRNNLLPLLGVGD